MSSASTHTATLQINGTTLSYIERGTGEPVLFVHGGLGDLRTWRGQVERFGEHYRSISYSRRGHYPNPWPEDFTASGMAQHAADLAAFIRALDIAPAHIVGNSYGSYVALYMALHAPRACETLSLAEPPVQPLLARLPGGDVLLESFMSEAWRPAGEAFRRGDLEEGVRLFIGGAVGADEFDRLPLRVRESMMKNAPELAVATQTDKRIHMPDITCDQLSRLDVPVLLMRGEHSPRMYYLINDELARCLPSACQALIPGAAHVLHSQNPEAHDETVLSFLAEHRGA